jgi:hypothetical protein
MNMQCATLQKCTDLCQKNNKSYIIQFIVFHYDICPQKFVILSFYYTVVTQCLICANGVHHISLGWHYFRTGCKRHILALICQQLFDEVHVTVRYNSVTDIIVSCYMIHCTIALQPLTPTLVLPVFSNKNIKFTEVHMALQSRRPTVTYSQPWESKT